MSHLSFLLIRYLINYKYINIILIYIAIYIILVIFLKSKEEKVRKKVEHIFFASFALTVNTFLSEAVYCQVWQRPLRRLR